MIQKLIAPLALAVISTIASAAEIEEVAASRWQWTGVAVTPDHRVFVNFPRWSDRMEYSVGVLDEQGRPSPFPDASWNDWQAGDPIDDSKFVAVQSVVTDAQGSLWVLDTGNPFFHGVLDGGPRLFEFDPATGRLVRSFAFESPVVKPNSYLNDVRFDVEQGYAFLTDSGAGGLVVLDLNSGEARRVLDGHPSTMAEPVDIVIDGKPWRQNGNRPQVHSDGIAYDAKKDVLYFHALTGRTMWSLPGSVLRDASLTDARIASSVELVKEDFPADGLLCDAKGRIYLSNLEDGAIDRFDPARPRAGIDRVVASPLIVWPDSFSPTPDGWIYFTTAQIHRGDNPSDPYRIFRFRIDD